MSSAIHNQSLPIASNGPVVPPSPSHSKPSGFSRKDTLQSMDFEYSSAKEKVSGKKRKAPPVEDENAKALEPSPKKARKEENKDLLKHFSFSASHLLLSELGFLGGFNQFSKSLNKVKINLGWVKTLLINDKVPIQSEIDLGANKDLCQFFTSDLVTISKVILDLLSHLSVAFPKTQVPKIAYTSSNREENYDKVILLMGALHSEIERSQTAMKEFLLKETKESAKASTVDILRWKVFQSHWNYFAERYWMFSEKFFEFFIPKPC